MKAGTLAAVLLICAAPLAGQTSVDGRWTGVIAAPQGDQNVTITLAAADTLLTGTISNFQGGEQPIEDGVVKGDSISFWQTLDFDGNALEIFYSALAHAEEMVFTLEVIGMPQTMRFTVKRAPRRRATRRTRSLRRAPRSCR